MRFKHSGMFHYSEKTQIELKANSVDVQIISHHEKRVIMLEMSCLWIGGVKEKTMRKLPGTNTYDGKFNNNIMDIRYNITLKWSSLEDGLKRSMEGVVKKLVGKRENAESSYFKHSKHCNFRAFKVHI